MDIIRWFDIRRDKKIKSTRIKTLLKKALKVDKNLQVFGSENHKYKLNKCITVEEINKLEKKYNIALPNDYRDFVINVGNGGVGPYYGIYPLNCEKDNDEFKYASKPCRLFPNMSQEEWQEVLKEYNNMPDDIANEEYDCIYNEVWQGMITIGTQGCTYDMMLVISGEHKGRVVYVDRTMNTNIPFFTYEDSYIDWYERWLNEIIKGYDITWFGFKMAGDELELTDKFKICNDTKEKLRIIDSMFKFRELTKETKELFYNTYIEEEDKSIKNLILNVLAKYKDVRMKKLLKEALYSDNKNEAIKIIFYYDKENFNSWYKNILEILHQLNGEGIRFAFYILTGSNDFNCRDLLEYFNHEDYEVRRSVTYEFGKLKNKDEFIKEFIQALKDDNPYVVHTAIQATYDIKDSRLIPIYSEILNKYYNNDNYHICSNLKRAFETFDIDYKEIMRNIKFQN